MNSFNKFLWIEREIIEQWNKIITDTDCDENINILTANVLYVLLASLTT